MAHPLVIACGQKHVSVKTGNSFPAFLIQFPAHEDGSGEICCFWRTRRDFLLLNRALQKYDATKSFPKSAFNKLCNRAIACGPWVRPDDESSCSYEVVHGQVSSAACIQSTKCKLDPMLKKSLYLIDSFLSDTNDLYSMGVDRSSGESESRAALQIVVDAWTLFCRDQDTIGLIVPDSDITQTSADDCGSLEKEETNAARLGQYFASDENAEDVVDTALHLIHKLGHDGRHIVMIEPSCGDGRIVLELLSNPSHVLNYAKVIGYDIDPSAIERSIQNLDGFAMPTNVQHKPVFRCNNFLLLSRQDLDKDLNLTAESCLTVAFGGPPYTPKELPEKFILHSIHELRAEIVVFILPSRCVKDAVRIQEMLNCPSDGRRWQFVNKDLANINFDFKGSNIMQPSILQFWYLSAEDALN